MFFSMPVCRKPTSGTTLMIVSPSSSSNRRKTPCVEGCCGPMFSRMVSPSMARFETRCLISSKLTDCSCVMPSLLGVRLTHVDLVEVESELRLLVTERVILAQRIALPVVRHQDAAQVRMPFEEDAEHVEDLPLAPVG